MEVYTRQCLKRYFCVDVLSALMEVAAIYYMVYVVDMRGKTAHLILLYRTCFRVAFTVKSLLHLFPITFYGLSGSFLKVGLLLRSRSVYDASVQMKLSGDAKSNKVLVALRAKKIMGTQVETKRRVFYSYFAFVYFSVLLLELEHKPKKILDLTIMTLYATVLTFGVFMPYVYMPDVITIANEEKDKEARQNSRLGLLVFFYCGLVLAGWMYGNYVSILDWDPAYMYFPNANYIGICLGHLGAAIVGTVIISV